MSILIKVLMLLGIHPWNCRFDNSNRQAVALSLTCVKIKPKLAAYKFFLCILIKIVNVAPSQFYEFISGLEPLGRVWCLFFFLFLLLFHDLCLLCLFIKLLLVEINIIVYFFILFLLI